MLNSLQDGLIREAYKLYGIVHPISGVTFEGTHFTTHTDNHGLRFMLFWFNDIYLSSHVMRQYMDCPNCNTQLQFGDINCKGHCTPCEQRGV